MNVVLYIKKRPSHEDVECLFVIDVICKKWGWKSNLCSEAEFQNKCFCFPGFSVINDYFVVPSVLTRTVEFSMFCALKHTHPILCLPGFL